MPKGSGCDSRIEGARPEASSRLTAVSAKKREPERRNGKLKVELPFEDAVKAALETRLPGVVKPAKRRTRKKPAS